MKNYPRNVGLTTKIAHFNRLFNKGGKHVFETVNRYSTANGSLMRNGVVPIILNENASMVLFELK